LLIERSRTCSRSVDTACVTQRFPVATSKHGEREEDARVEVSGGNLKWKCQSCVMDDLNKPVMWQCWRYYIGYNFSVATSVFMRWRGPSITQNYKKSVVSGKLLGGRTYWIVMPCEHVRY